MEEGGCMVSGENITILCMSLVDTELAEGAEEPAFAADYFEAEEVRAKPQHYSGNASST